MDIGAAFQEPGQERLKQEEGFSLSSMKLKEKRRKKDTFEVHGGRVIRSTGRKDRHSKVCTARGTRDRRLRLSPQTAILFYDVQDRLGYDRPSKAIDWLMTEAKAAIDALDESPPAAVNVAELHGRPPNSKNQQSLKVESGLIQNAEDSYDGNCISSFGFFSEAAVPPSSAEFQSAPLQNPQEIFDTNLEIARLQRILSWNYNFPVSTPPLHSPATVDLGHGFMLSDREPLQSRIASYSPQFPGMRFSNEDILNFTGAAAAFKEDEMGINPVSGKPSSAASFLHYEE